MLPVGSLAVAPVNAVEVGEGCSLVWDDDRDGTFNSVRFFFGCSGTLKVAEEVCSFVRGADAVRTTLSPSTGVVEGVLVGGVGVRPRKPAAAMSGCGD